MNAILTIAEAAERMSVSRQRMHKLIESYSLETSKVNGRLIVLHEGELKKIPKERKNNSAAKAQAVKLDRMIKATEEAAVLAQLSQLIEKACADGDSILEISKRSKVSKSVIYAIRQGCYSSSPAFEKVAAICEAVGMELTMVPKKNNS